MHHTQLSARNIRNCWRREAEEKVRDGTPFQQPGHAVDPASVNATAAPVDHRMVTRLIQCCIRPRH
jgi:hypothetical protein